MRKRRLPDLEVNPEDEVLEWEGSGGWWVVGGAAISGNRVRVAEREVEIVGKFK